MPIAFVLASCGYPEFSFTPATDTGSALDSYVDSDMPLVDTSMLEDVVEDTSDTATSDTSADTAETAVDSGPTCTSNFGCPCGQICSSGKCVASTDCTKDSHYCPAGVTCKCIAGRWDIDGTGSGAASLLPAQPVKTSDDGNDLNIRNYSIHDTSGTTYAMRIRPANCTSGWYYRNINIQCVDFAGLDAAGPSALNISRRTDPLACRPATPPELLLDRVNITTLDSYSAFEDVEFSKVTLRKVTTTGSGLLVAAWGPGQIAQLVIEDSPNLYTELQGKVPSVTVKTSPNFRWWASSPSEARDATWPLITITYDKASCPSGRPLTSTAQVKELCP